MRGRSNALQSRTQLAPDTRRNCKRAANREAAAEALGCIRSAAVGWRPDPLLARCVRRAAAAALAAAHAAVLTAEQQRLLTHTHSSKTRTKNHNNNNNTPQNRYVEAEKTNGRWAMAAVAGILGTELLGVTPKWFEAGAKDYGVPIAPLVAVQFLIMGFLETKRYQGFKETGTVSVFLYFLCVVSLFCTRVFVRAVGARPAAHCDRTPQQNKKPKTQNYGSRASSTASPLTRRA